MSHVSLKEVLADARRNSYGIPCLIGGSLEMIIGQIMAAEEKNSPLILFFNEQVTPRIPIELGVPLMVNAAQRARVPVATILDHGMSFASIMKVIHLGASSVMFDGSSLPYEENVEQTKEIVKIAHSLGVSVEAELGAVGGSAVEIGEGTELPKNVFTDPDLVRDFIAKTGIDALAVSFGNQHGPYHGDQKLDYTRVRKIYSMVDIPLVMHGGSGLGEHKYKKIVASGISKVNYYSAMARAAGENMRVKTAEAAEKAIYHDIINWNIDFFYEETKKLIDILGCARKADRVGEN